MQSRQRLFLIANSKKKKTMMTVMERMSQYTKRSLRELEYQDLTIPQKKNIIIHHNRLLLQHQLRFKYSQIQPTHNKARLMSRRYIKPDKIQQKKMKNRILRQEKEVM